MRATFGPSRASLDNLTGTPQYAAWVRAQLDLPASLHREYYRRRVNSRLASYGSLRVGAKTGACSPGARWVNYAIGFGDIGKPVQITASRRLKVDGQFRTDLDTGHAGNGLPAPAACTNTYLNTNTNCDSMARGWSCAAGGPFWSDNPTVGGPLCQQSCFDYGYGYAGDDCSPGWTGSALSGFQGYICRVKNDTVGGWVQLSTRAGCDRNLRAMLIPAVWVADPATAVPAGQLQFRDGRGGVKVLAPAAAPGGPCALQADSVLSLGQRYYAFDSRLMLLENTVESPSVMAVDGECGQVRPNFVNEDACQVVPSCQGYICGSPGEVANDPTRGHMLPMEIDGPSFSEDKDHDYYKEHSQNSAYTGPTVWFSLAVRAEDQLRQRVAWALAQIFVINIHSIGNHRETEVWTSAYDMYVRHAFGNYRDLLQEVSFNPIMAFFLTYMWSRCFDASGTYPDENYAREIMQLFSIGLWKLNPDGSEVLDAQGLPVPTYGNEHIQNFARVFTGFDQQPGRANIESPGDGNRLDPMRIQPGWHDVYPKPDLDGNFLGDGYPLCRDLPAGAAHQAGATYVYTSHGYAGDDVVVLEPSSPLHQALCGGSNSAACDFAFKVVLGSTIPCHGTECEVLLRKVKVGEAYYTHVPPKCVNLFFFDGKLTARAEKFNWPKPCTNPDAPVAGTSCCGGCSDTPNQWMTDRNLDCQYLKVHHNPAHFCHNSHWLIVKHCQQTCFDLGLGYSGDNCSSGVPFTQTRVCAYERELVSYHTAAARCRGRGLEVCGDETSQQASCGFDNNYYVWLPDACSLSVAVRPDGAVSSQQDASTAQNFFAVPWEGGGYPSVGQDGGCPGGCTADQAAGTCVCTVSVASEPVFDRVPTGAELEAQLHIGAFAPATGCTQACDGEVRAYMPSGAFDALTVFAHKGRYYKNAASKVAAGGGVFRNPPAFMVRELPAARDAEAEVGSLLDHLLGHPNTPTFIGRQLIQRLVSSNPSGAYVRDVAEAFRSGRFGGVEYSGSRGDMAATVAAVLLHPEALGPGGQNASLYGTLREPLVKLAHLARALEYTEQSSFNDRPLMLTNTKDVFGQYPYWSDTVFNFYSPFFVPAFFPNGVYSPEFQIFTTPDVVGFFNGVHAMINHGLDNCNGGFGAQGRYCGFNGGFTFPDPSSSDDVIAELDLYLTGGRLGDKIDIVRAAYDSAAASDKLKAAERAIVMTPEFNTQGDSLPQGTRVWPVVPEPPAPRSYKAVVSIFMAGGADTFNMLVPFSTDCSLWAEYQQVRTNMALSGSQLLAIDTRGMQQGCQQFGVHHRLPVLQQLYNSREAAFVASVGSLSHPLTKANFKNGPKCVGLFSHSDQQNAAQNLKCQEFHASQGGVGGRIGDALHHGPGQYMTSTFSINGNAVWAQGKQTTQLIINAYSGAGSFNNYNSMRAMIHNITTKRHGHLFSDSFSVELKSSLANAETLSQQLAGASVQTNFPSSKLGQQLRQVASLISVRGQRKAERDLFFTQIGSFDTHQDMHGDTSTLFGQLNDALTSFVAEMRAQGIFDSVVVVSSSDFGRTLTSNGHGTDHGWAGNYFVVGGGVRGKQILGQYPGSLAGDHSHDIGRGRIIPQMPWEGVMVPVAEWLGVQPAQFPGVFPNLGHFNASTDVIEGAELFG